MRNFLITKKHISVASWPALKSLEWFSVIVPRHSIKRPQKSYSAVNTWMLWKSPKNATLKYFKN